MVVQEDKVFDLRRVELSEEDEKIFQEFSQWSPSHARMVTLYHHWGKDSIVIYLGCGLKYKVKRYGKDNFVMQVVSDEDIERKLNKRNDN